MADKKRSEQFLTFLDQTPSHEDVTKLFAALTTVVKQLNAQLHDRITATDTNASSALHNGLQSVSTRLNALERQIADTGTSTLAQLQQHVATLQAAIDDVQTQIPEVPDPYDDTALASRLLAIDKELEQLRMADDTRNRLEVLKGDDRLNAAAIAGLEEFVTDVVKRDRPLGTQTGWGAHPLTIAGSGTVKSKVTRHINFKGTGVSSVTRNPDGTVDVTISGGAGGVGAWSTPAETVNGSTTVFTVSAQPTDVVADGITLFPSVGYTYAALQITLTNAPQIYVRYR